MHVQWSLDIPTTISPKNLSQSLQSYWALAPYHTYTGRNNTCTPQVIAHQYGTKVLEYVGAGCKWGTGRLVWLKVELERWLKLELERWLNVELGRRLKVELGRRLKVELGRWLKIELEWWLKIEHGMPSYLR